MSGSGAKAKPKKKRKLCLICRCVLTKGNVAANLNLYVCKSCMGVSDDRRN